ncbi:hypothetical protein FHR81_000135 [Actinoalloteichus hoggarensis]|uniref:Probable membrane transporter protein n=1 Tax=Actinoalloteichus hoggarensis TaxID=1470176 RepID=A0A221W3G8_9PSEU|nr:sulfite exporter TauE/SafE family protein [Actinoalloteichus hoggarensis]ASO20181.1 Sulfite exporter TauE/SafE [Actinoalloteichus hoggarensis]MBB5919106.1 hypothetical protein [Actinoalloteichus hoggarensis]
MSGVEFVIAGLAVLVGAALQGTIGLGLGMLAGPILALLDPTLVPGPLLMLATVLTLVVVLRERAALDLAGTGWALAGRVPGTAAGALLVAVLSPDAVTVVLAAVVLLGTVISALGWTPHPTRPALLLAGAASGVMGTATSIGGPPMALVWQRLSGARLRAMMSAFFLVGCLLSLTALAIVGELTVDGIAAAAPLIPFVLLGYLGSRLLGRALDHGRLRVLALSVCAASALILLAGHLF